MSGQVHANPEHLKRLQRDVDKCVEAVSQALKDLERSLDRADWKDGARDDFESKLKDATSNSRRTTLKLTELRPILTKHLSALQQYR